MISALDRLQEENGSGGLLRWGRNTELVGRQRADHKYPFRYPWEIEEWTSLRSGRRVILRPIRPGDVKAYRELFSRLDPDDIRFRFFSYLKEPPQIVIRRFENINYDREINIVANALDRKGCPEMLGVIGGFLDVEISSVEFALIVRSDLKRQGLGTILLSKLIRYCFVQGFGKLTAEVLKSNHPMIALTESLGFELVEKPMEEEVLIQLRLR